MIGIRAPITGRIAPAATSGQTSRSTSATMSALEPWPVTGRDRSVVPRTVARLVSSAPRSSSALVPPCIPMIVSRPSGGQRGDVALQILPADDVEDDVGARGRR